MKSNLAAALVENPLLFFLHSKAPTLSAQLHQPCALVGFGGQSFPTRCSDRSRHQTATISPTKRGPVHLDAHPHPPGIVGTNRCRGVVRLDSLRDFGGLRNHPSFENATDPAARDILQCPVACYCGVPTLVKGPVGGFTSGRHILGVLVGEMRVLRYPGVPCMISGPSDEELQPGSSVYESSKETLPRSTRFLAITRKPKRGERIPNRSRANGKEAAHSAGQQRTVFGS